MMESMSDELQIRRAMELANSPEGRRLIGMLRQQNAQDMQVAMERAASGDYEAARKALGPVLASPEIRRLLDSLKG